MIGKLLLSELKVQANHWSWFCALLLSFIFGAFVINKQTPDMDIQISGVYFLIKTFAIQLLILPIVVAVFSANATVRDSENRTVELVYAGCRSLQMLLWARFIALIAVCFSVYISFAFGLGLGLLNQNPASVWLASTTIAISLLVLALPAVVLIAAIFFSVGITTRRVAYLYVVACLLFFAYQFFLVINGSPLMARATPPSASLLTLYSWLDPFGLSAYFEQAKGWSPEQKNLQLPWMESTLLLNRVLTLGAALCLTYFVVRGQSRDPHLDSQNAHSWFQSRKGKVSRRSLSHSYLPFSQTLTIAKMQWQLSVKTKTFMLMCLMLSVAVATEIYSGYQYLESLGTSAVASTMITVNRFISDVLPRFGGLFLLILAAEVCWRDSESNIKPLVDSTRIANSKLLFGRLIALLFVPIFFVTLAVFVAVLMQLLNGGEINGWVYIALYPLIALPLMWQAALYLILNSLLANKYVALGASLVLFIATQTSVMASMGLEHPFWTLGQLPEFSYSEITGFGAQLDGFTGFMLFKLSIIMVLGAIALHYFNRGEERVHSFNRAFPWQQKEKNLLVSGGIVTLISVVNIFYQTSIEGNYQSSTARHAFKASYEQKFASYKALPTLKPKQVKTWFELDLNSKRIAVKGEYVLENRTNSPISQLLVTTPAPFNYSQIEVASGELIEHDAQLHTRLYKLSKAVMPNESTRFSFAAEYQQNGYLPLPADNYLSKDFTYLRFLRYLPWFGYIKHYELQHQSVRDDYALPALERRTLEEDLEHYQGDMSSLYDWAQLDTTIVTGSDHVAVAPGKLVEHHTVEGTSVFHYQTGGPVRNLGYIVSSPLEKHSGVHDGIKIDIFAPEAKQQYTALHMQAIKDALQYGNQHFGKLGFNQLNLFSVADFFPATGYALPQSIFIGEDVGFHVDLDNEHGFDHLYRRTVHEVAHQWWGHGLNGAPTEGEAVLVETLAKYTEMVLLAQKYGEKYVKQLIEFEQQRYFAGRAFANSKELPLYRADDNHLVYSKGAAAMYALRQQLGESAINRALADLFKHHRYPNKPATTLDLITYLKAASDDEQHHLIDDWFSKVDVADVSVTTLERNQSSAGEQLRFCVDGAENMSVPVAVYNEHEKLIAQKVIMPSATHPCAYWQLTKKPDLLVLDPDLLLLDSNRDNNRVYVN
ncbi:M1 family aminopeptidase [Pseudoalteromonas sp. T1lg65]|uniref:M1 family aminopeptidase n=1 Tax=Pseudoalteromonas sp. T1lg65 TaxID=2077101 RepID=UPI003F79239E